MDIREREGREKEREKEWEGGREREREIIERGFSEMHGLKVAK